MSKSKKHRIIAILLTFALTTPLIPQGKTSLAVSNEYDSAAPIMLGKALSGTLEKGESYWYKLDIPDKIRDQSIKITFMAKNGYYGCMSGYLCDSTGATISYVYGIEAGKSNYIEKNIKDADGDKDTLAKGETYYLKALAESPGWGKTYGGYTVSVSGDYKTKPLKSKLSVTAKKGTSTITIKTISGASVTIKSKKKILKQGFTKLKSITTVADTGKVKISLSRKLKKGDKITIISKKIGYETKKVTKQII